MKISVSNNEIWDHQLKSDWKPSNEKKIEVDDQEEPIDLEDFDYIIPHLSSIEDLLKVTIKKIDITNDKIDYITRDFIKNQTQLPWDLFLDNDFDGE